MKPHHAAILRDDPRPEADQEAPTLTLRTRSPLPLRHQAHDRQSPRGQVRARKDLELRATESGPAET
ncbi:MAG: hypothetical protein KAI47_17735, partial [Deltaproteobacteria bacterium]|nr:hypothetical protein [Deltaproteobacteria bacterium]